MREQIVKILTELRPEFDFSADINFIEEGMLDSFDIVSLVDAIDEKLGVVISGLDILPENFESLVAIENVINKNR
ncbi:MAG: phosphopantetheine-binding protein [Odoribacter splanchnicus]